MLRRANEFLARALARAGRALAIPARALRPFARTLFGQWQPPAWLAAAGAGLLAVGRPVARNLAAALLAAGVAVLAWLAAPAVQQQWAVRGVVPQPPQPLPATAAVSEPARTEIENDRPPSPVAISFSRPVAPLALVGKEAAAIDIQPAIEGRWTWASESRLEFQPKADWPIGQRYKVSLGGKALAAHVAPDKRQFEFNAPRFMAQIEGAEFYQDPTQAQLRRTVFQVRFSHPVNTAEFEKRVHLGYEGACVAQVLRLASCPSEKFSVSYDKFKLAATVQSEPLPIPEQLRTMTLRLKEGVPAQRGGPATPADVQRSVDIPGLYNAQITKVEAAIVTGENGEPEHVLHVAASMPVHERELARVVQAWVLPAKKNDKDEAETFDWQAEPEAIDDAVLKRATRVQLQPIAGEREVVEGVSFRMPQAEGGRHLLVRVAKGMRTHGGYQLGQPRQEVLLLKTFAPELAIMSRGSLLALSGEKKLAVLVRDLPGLRIEIGRLLPQQLQHLVTQTQGEFSRPEFYQGIQPDHLTERFEKTVTFTLRPGKAHYETVDFAQYLRADAADRRGVFLLTVQAHDPKAKPAAQGGAEARGDAGQEEQGDAELSEEERAEAMRKVDRRLVLVTDLGLVAKKALDGTRDVFVQSIATGQPVPGASVEVWARNGAVLLAQATDASGRATLPNLSGYQREKQPVLLAVRKAGDLSFLPLAKNDRALDVSRFDVGGLRSAGVPNQMTAYVFSDRGIYRPGDTVHIGVIVKAAQWATPLKDMPVEAEIIDARGLTVRREKLRLGPGGAAEISHTTQESSPTGNYTVNLLLPREAGAADTPPLLLGATQVKVQEFLPDRTRVVARLSSETPEGWVKPQELKARIDVQNLFGTPAPNRRVEGVLTLSPAYPVFRSHADYSFYDPQRAKDKQVDELGTAQTSDAGQAEFDLRLSRFAAATYQAHVLVKAFEPEGGRSVTAEAQSLVSDLEFLVGVKADGDLGYVNKGARRQASVIAIDPRARKTAAPKLRLQWLERKTLSVLVKQNNGLYRYESRRKDVLLDDKPFAIAAAGSQLVLNTGRPGNFAYVIRDEQGLEYNRVEYSVAGEANVTRSLDRNAELQLTLNRKDFNPGEEIEVSIRAPYAGAGLITIERDKVYAHAWFKTDKTASVQKITVPKGFEGSGYVNVHFIRDPASDEIYMSPLSYGVVPFATSLARRSANIQLTAPALVKPGETVRMRLASDKPTRAVLFAVDEGILQVGRYNTPDPLKHFFQKRALEVHTLQTLDLILPEFRKLMHAAAPGGDAEGEAGKHLNPFKRKRDKPVVFWSGLVDVNGSREFSYTVPESFNGSLRVMAVAVNDEQTAARSARTLVRGDMVILPNVPLALAPGDTVEVGVGVANNIAGSGKEAPIALTLEVTGGLEVVGPAQQQLKINERGEASTRYQLRAKPGAEAKLGSASVIFTAQHKNVRSRLATDVSVRPASPYVTLVQAGTVLGQGELKAQGAFYPAHHKSDVTLSAAPWAFAPGLLQYLEQYPHGCTEQITSQTFPAVLLATRPELARDVGKGKDGAPDARKQAEQTLARYVAQLRARQVAEGGIALWPGSGADPFATVYALHLLLEARDRKLPVPADMIQKANGYLQGWVGRPESQRHHWRQRAQAAYLLTRQGIPVPAALADLREAWRAPAPGGWRDDLGAVYLAASYQLLKQESVAGEMLQPAWQDLLDRVDKKTRRSHWEAYYDPMVHDAMVMHLVARHFPARLKNVPPAVWLRSAEMLRENWYNSLSSAAMLLAIEAYSDAVLASASGKLGGAALDAQGQSTPLAFSTPKPVARAVVPSTAAKLQLSNGGDLPLYYAWAEQGFERNVPQQAVSKGLEILHEVVDGSGKVITEARLGDEVFVRVRVRTLERAAMGNVAVVDMLPGGLEPVLNLATDTEANANAPAWQRRLGSRGNWTAIDYADVREDRVVFYGTVGPTLLETGYKVRATNVGEFVVPPAYAEAMYDRRVYGRSAGAKFKVLPAN